MRRLALATSLVLCLAAAGCGKDPLAALIAPTVTVTVTETFTGTLTRNGATTHFFPVTSTAGGEVTATLKTVSPDNTTVVGLSMGTWNGTSCLAVISNDRATQAASILGRATSTGALCVRLFDPGTIVTPQDYEIEVVHP